MKSWLILWGYTGTTMGYWNINVLLVNNPSVSLNWDFEWEHH
jgi:hypothetical protein